MSSSSTPKSSSWYEWSQSALHYARHTFFRTQEKAQVVGEREFAAIAFLVSALALFLLSSSQFLLAAAVGGIGHYLLDPEKRLPATARAIPIENTVLAVIA